VADAPLSAQTRLDCCYMVDIHISTAKIFFGHHDCDLKSVSGSLAEMREINFELIRVEFD